MFENNIKELLNSKRFWTAVVGVVTMIIVSIVPTLADQADQLNTILVLIVGSLIGGFTLTDIQEAKASAKQ